MQRILRDAKVQAHGRRVQYIYFCESLNELQYKIFFRPFKTRVSTLVVHNSIV